MLFFKLLGLPLLVGAGLYLAQWVLTALRRGLRFLLPVLAALGWALAVWTGWRNNPEGFAFLMGFFFAPYGLTALVGLWRGTRRGLRRHVLIRVRNVRKPGKGGEDHGGEHPHDEAVPGDQGAE